MAKTQDVTVYDESSDSSLKVETNGSVNTNGRLVDGTNPAYAAIVTQDGRLKTDSIVTIEETFGYDNFADHWVLWQTVGSIGGTIRYRIQGGASGDVTYTVTALDTDKYELAKHIAAALNANSLFTTKWFAKVFNEIVFIIAKLEGERGEAPLIGDVLITMTGSPPATYMLDSDFQDRIIRRSKTAVITPSLTDNRIGVLGVQGEVSSVIKSENPIYINILKNLATAAETVFVDRNVTAKQTWFISQVIGASELDAKLIMYRGIQRLRVETWTGTTSQDKLLDYQSIPLEGIKYSVTVNGVLTTGFLILDDPTDDTKSILRWTGNNNVINGKTIQITYDAVDRVLVAFIQKPGTANIPLETPMKLFSSQFITITVQNRSANAGEVSATMVGFYEEEI
jgi:hypothetical protein